MKQLHGKKGFGLVEVLLATLIIIIVIMALLYVGRLAISNLSDAQRRAQATMLAQEAIEGVREIRDTNYLDGDPATDWNCWGRAGQVCWDLTHPTVKLPHFWWDGMRFRLITEATGEALGDVEVGENSKYHVDIYKQSIATTNILQNPVLRDGDAERGNKAYVIKAVVSWEDKNVTLEELIADSRQGF